jgi:multimeric flavodoxin WrbA
MNMGIGKENHMKVIGFNGSPRKDGNTAILMNHVFKELEKEGIETEMVQLSAKEIHGCIACFKCIENKDQQCAVKNDGANEYIGMMTKAQGIILGSPVYSIDVTPQMKALIERSGFVSRANGGMYRNKVGGALTAFRRSGAMHAIDTMNHFFLGQEIFVVGRAVGIGKDKGDVEKDEEGMRLAKSLGQRMAWLLKKVYS